MPRRKRVVIKPAEEQFEVVVTGGPKKYLNRRRVRKRFARQAVYAYEPISAQWFQDLTQQIAHARRYQGMSQQTLAGILGTSQAEISRLESGKANPTAELLDRIFRALKAKVITKIT